MFGGADAAVYRAMLSWLRPKRIIEAGSGQDHYAYMRENIFRPAGNTAFLIDADRGYTVVVLCNGDPPAAENALKKIRGLLPRT